VSSATSTWFIPAIFLDFRGVLGVTVFAVASACHHQCGRRATKDAVNQVADELSAASRPLYTRPRRRALRERFIPTDQAFCSVMILEQLEHGRVGAPHDPSLAPARERCSGRPRDHSTRRMVSSAVRLASSEASSTLIVYEGHS